MHQKGTRDSNKAQRPSGGMRGEDRRKRFTSQELLYKTVVSRILFSMFPLEVTSMAFCSEALYSATPPAYFFTAVSKLIQQQSLRQLFLSLTSRAYSICVGNIVASVAKSAPDPKVWLHSVDSRWPPPKMIYPFRAQVNTTQ